MRPRVNAWQVLPSQPNRLLVADSSAVNQQTAQQNILVEIARRRQQPADIRCAHIRRQFPRQPPQIRHPHANDRHFGINDTLIKGSVGFVTLGEVCQLNYDAIVQFTIPQFRALLSVSLDYTSLLPLEKYLGSSLDWMKLES